MAATNRKAIAGSIHRIREFELEKVCLAEEFDILQIVGEGWFGKILLVEHRGTDTEMVLKALPKPYVPLRDFYREFHYGLHLGAHKNIITTYDVAFETAGFYVFSQEYAPLGDLTSNVSDTGIGELHTKRVAKQLAAALEHLHARDLVHRDVKLDNILVFKSDFSRIKLCDFGETRKSMTVIRRRNEWLPYSPPEVLQTAVEDTYKAVTSHDVWQFGIVIFVCLTGCLPWQKAAPDDPRYVRYLNWYNTSNPLKKQPKLFKLVSSRAQRFFKKILEPRSDKRPQGLTDLQKYMDDRWMAKGINDKNGTAGVEIDELCPSMYSFHSDIDEKNKLLHVLLQHGIETTVDRVAKKARIRDWIQNSVITEEDENEAEDIFNSEDEDREEIHPIEKNHERWSSLRYADEKHINPRTGEVLEKGKATNYVPMNVSYDMQQIQPITDGVVRYTTNGKDESPSQGSMRDSAYGSIDLRGSSTNALHSEQNLPQKIAHDQHVPANAPYPSQQLQKHLQQHSTTKGSNTMLPPSPSPLQHFKKVTPSSKRQINGNSASSKGSPFASSDLRDSQMKMQQRSASTSTSTLTKSSVQNLTPARNTDSPLSHQRDNFTPMKNGPYDINNLVQQKTEQENQDDGKDYQMNVVQGQMRINPYAALPAKSHSSHHINGRVMSPKTIPIQNGNGNQSLNNISRLDEEDQNSLMQIKKILIENKTGLSE